LHPVPGQVVVRGARRQHLQCAACEPEGRGPDGVATRPLHEILETTGQERVRNLLEPHQAASVSRSGATAAGSSPPAPGFPDARRTPGLARSTSLCIGPQSSAPVDNRYANGTRSVSRNTPMIASPYAAGTKLRKMVVNATGKM